MNRTVAKSCQLLALGCLSLLAPLAARAADFRPGQIVLVRRFGKMEEVRVVRQDEHGVLVQFKDWQDHTFHDNPAVAPTMYYQPNEVQPNQPARPAAPPKDAPPRGGEGNFTPGQIVTVRHNGRMEEARVVRQDEHGVLVQWKDWQDGTFHDDPAVAPTEYRQPDELKPAGPQAKAKAPAPRDPAADNADDDGPMAPPPAPPAPRRQAPPPLPLPKAPPLPQTPDAPAAGALPDGEYYCYTYNPRPVVAGVFTINGGTYRSRTGATGRYQLGVGGRITWMGTPPLGFNVGVLEETNPPKIRMYPQVSDVGNKWKAAVCMPRDADAGAAGPGGEGGGNPAAAGAFAPGTNVWYSFLGHWYKATVVSCNGDKCRVHYEDPKYADETVDAKELQVR